MYCIRDHVKYIGIVKNIIAKDYSFVRVSNYKLLKFKCVTDCLILEQFTIALAVNQTTVLSC